MTYTDPTTDIETILIAVYGDGPLARPAPVWNHQDELLETISDLQGQLRRVHENYRNLQAALATANQQHERHIEDITNRLHEEANNRSFCSEFDDMMEELGLQRRTTEYAVTFTITLDITVDVEAANEDEAAEMARDELGVGRYVDLGDHTADVVNVDTEVNPA